MTNPLRDDFLRGMSNAAASVNIIATDGPAGRAGVTVSAMSSVSADTDKPTLLTCVHHLSPAAQKIIDNGCFVVNVLRDDQTYISDTFAGRFKDQVADKFDCCDWQAMHTGAPRVVDPLVGFDCKVVSSERVGTHHVIFGEVQQVFLAPHGSPLIYAHRSYGNHNRIESAASIAAGRAGGNRLALGVTQGLGADLVPGLLARLLAATPDLDITLVEGDQRRVLDALRGGEVETALLLDQHLPEGLTATPVLDLHPMVLLPMAHALAEKSAITPADLADLPLIHLTAQPCAQALLQTLRDAGVDPTIALRTASEDTARGLIARGLGYALVTSNQESIGLVTRPLLAPAALRIVLARREAGDLSAAAQALRALIFP